MECLRNITEPRGSLQHADQRKQAVTDRIEIVVLTGLGACLLNGLLGTAGRDPAQV
ncbi:MAG: hypothetical protein MZV64_10285 [Ignavibacteriales bacterium]|nr:hypothetical protein [Ignavibacteriales bacterium]